VVRLKGGDPMIFGRAGEEIAACPRAHIPVEVGARHFGCARARRRACSSRSRIARSTRACNTSPATTVTAGCPPTSTGSALPIRGDHDRLHAEEDAARRCRARDGARPRSRNARSRGGERDAAGRDDRCGTIADIAERIEADAPDGPLLVMIGSVTGGGRRAGRTRKLRSCPRSEHHG
jgi:hypothetical protein